MFDARADQAAGLRRLFRPRAPAVVPMGCCAPPADCRRYAAIVSDRLARSGTASMLVDRQDAADPLGGLVVAPEIGRVLLLDEPVRLSRWLDGRQSTMLLLLSHQRDAMPVHYAAIKSISLGHGIRRFAALFVDATTAEQARDAGDRLAGCARRFLGVDVVPLVRDAATPSAAFDASLGRLGDFEIGLPAPVPAAAPH